MSPKIKELDAKLTEVGKWHLILSEKLRVKIMSLLFSDKGTPVQDKR